MTPAFVRLALIGACTGYVLGLLAVARWCGWPYALIAALAGIVLAVIVAEDFDRPPVAVVEPIKTRAQRLRELRDQVDDAA